MQVDATPGALVVRFGSRFGTPDAERAAETIRAFAPITTLTLDFRDVREFDQTAIVPLLKALGALRDVDLRLRGLTRHQARVLRYFGVEEGRASALAVAAGGG